MHSMTYVKFWVPLKHGVPPLVHLLLYLFIVVFRQSKDFFINSEF